MSVCPYVCLSGIGETEFSRSQFKIELICFLGRFPWSMSIYSENISSVSQLQKADMLKYRNIIIGCYVRERYDSLWCFIRLISIYLWIFCPSVCWSGYKTPECQNIYSCCFLSNHDFLFFQLPVFHRDFL